MRIFRELKHWIGRAAVGGLCVLSAALAVAAPVDWVPAAVNSYFLEDNTSEHDGAPKVASDKNGNWMVLWASYLGDSEYPIRKTALKIAHSSDVGEHWSDSVTLPADLANSEEPEQFDLEYTGNGVWMAYWADYALSFPDGRFYFSLSSDNGANWSAPQVLGTNMWKLNTASDGNGNVLGIYRSRITPLDTDENLWLIRSTDSGVTWSAREPVTQGLDSVVPSVIASGGNGKWYIGLNSQEPANGSQTAEVLASVDNGLTWQSRGAFPGVPIRDMAARGDTVSLIANYATVFTSVNGGESFLPWPHSAPYQSSVKQLDFNMAGTWLNFNSVGEDGSLVAWNSPDAVSWMPVTGSESEPVYVPVGSLAGGAGNDFVVAYQVRRQAAYPTNRDFDIQARSSRDGGVTWSVQLYVNADAAVDETRIDDVNLNIAGGGNTVLASWVAPYGPVAYKFWQTLMVARSTDAGITWSEAMTVHAEDPSGTSLYSDNKPLYLGDNQWVVYRTRQVMGFDGGVYTTTHSLVGVSSADDGITWSNPILPPGYLIAGSDNGVLLAAEKASGGKTRISSSMDLGVTWQAGAIIPMAQVAHLVHGDDQTWMAMGAGNEVIKLTNHGATWADQGVASNLYGISPYGIFTNHRGRLIATGYVSSSPGQSITASIFTTVSVDYGASWSVPKIVDSVTDETFNLFSYSFPANPEAIPVSENSWLLVTGIRANYALSNFGGDLYSRDSKVYMAKSGNGGNSWGESLKILEFNNANEPNLSLVWLLVPDTRPSFAVSRDRVIVGSPQRFWSGNDLDLFSLSGKLPKVFSAAADWQLYE